MSSGSAPSEATVGKRPTILEAGNVPKPTPHSSEASSATLIGDQVNDPAPGCHTDEAERPEEMDGDEEERAELEERAKKPWYKRPSPRWIIAISFISVVISSTTFAPRIDVYTRLACEALRAEHVEGEPRPRLVDWSWRRFPPPPKSCTQDDQVQEAVAALSTMISVASGILTCLTTGWWGQLSDRHGRVTIVKFCAIGFLINDFNFLLVALAADFLPGGYRFLVFGAIISGCLGGFSSVGAAITAYMSDTTAPELRSRNFSLSMGLIMAGMACGPAIGSYIIRITQDLLSVFYLATLNHLVFIIFLMFILPESLTKASMRKARKRHATQRHGQTAEVRSASSWTESIKARTRLFLSHLLAPIAPLAIFIPHKKAHGKGSDWNMLFLIATMVLNATLIGTYAFKFQYMQKAFGWDSGTTGIWLTIVGATRGIFLILILPGIIHFFKPTSPPIELPISEDEPLNPSSEPFSHIPNVESHRNVSRSPSKSRAARKTVKFDYYLALGSIFVELVSYIGMSVAMSSIQWTAATVLGSFSSGFGPAMRSVALALYERSPAQGVETGKLFGAIGIADAFAAHVFSPVLFGWVFIKTVETFPKGIFVLATVMSFLATLALLFVRISSSEPARPVAAHDQEATAVERLIDDQ